MSLLPSRLDVSPSPDEPRVVDIDTEEAEATFDALGSETAREVLAAVYREPRTPPEVREAVGTSLQNVHYHLANLEDAGLIEPAGLGYSEKGTEMTVYAPASEAVVLFAGHEEDGSRLRSVLGQVLGLFVLVALSTLAFAALHRRFTSDPEPEAGALDAPGPDTYADSAAQAAGGVDPVVAFFLGGAAVVLALAAWWLLRPRLRSSGWSR